MTISPPESPSGGRLARQERSGNLPAGSARIYQIQRHPDSFRNRPGNAGIPLCRLKNEGKVEVSLATGCLADARRSSLHITLRFTFPLASLMSAERRHAAL